MSRRRAAWLLCLALGACPAPGAPPGNGDPDASAPPGPDAAPPDAAPGPPDAQVADAARCTEDDRPDPNGSIAAVEPPGVGGCPDGMLAVDAFCIDRYEASLWRLESPSTALSPYFNPAGEAFVARSIAAAVPQGYVSGTQAAEACANAGKRLCSDDEWLRACRGPGSSTYPYGDTRQPGVCNDARAMHPAIEYFGTSADWIWSELGHPCINQLPDSLDPTGHNPGCVTAEGAFDMMGNLHEWTADPAGTFRGGFYVDTVINGEGCLYRTTAHGMSHWDYSTGFRCCADLP
jgi:hypothetical protein